MFQKKKKKKKKSNKKLIHSNASLLDLNSQID